MDWMNSLVSQGGECGQVNPAVDLAQQFTNPDLHSFSPHHKANSSQNPTQESSSVLNPSEPTFEMKKILDRMQQINVQKLKESSQVQNSTQDHTTQDHTTQDQDKEKLLEQQSSSFKPTAQDVFLYNQNEILSDEFHKQSNQSFESSKVSGSSIQKQNHQSYLSYRSNLRLNYLKANSFLEESMKECQESLARDDMLMKILMETLHSSAFTDVDSEAQELDFNLSEQSEVKQDSIDNEYQVWAQIAEDLKMAQTSDSTIDDRNLFNPEVNVLETAKSLTSQNHPNYYHFVENNPFLTNIDQEEKSQEVKEKEMKNFLQQGIERMKLGDISGAVLFFEAAAITDPESKKAWLELGKAQSKNENDRKAIAALKRSLALESNNLEAWMSLAICFTNETMSNEACHSLKEWITRHPKYSELLKKNLETTSEPEHDKAEEYKGPTPLWRRWQVKNVFETKLFDSITQAFIEAAISGQSLPDPDIQIGLGVLYSLNGDYSKASDCWRTAVQLRQNDHTLWNRLGASLANGGQPEAAIDAYKHALSLYPGYSRARYNLAVSCILMGANNEAILHLLTILNHQESGARNAMESIGGSLTQMLENPSKLTSRTVWSTLTSALIQNDREDLLDLVQKKDLSSLNRALEFRLYRNRTPDMDE